LAEVAPDRYAKVPRTLRGAELIGEEQRVCAIAYPEAGYELATHWHLPEDMANCIRFHHAPALMEGDADLVAMANLAWLISTVSLDEDSRMAQATDALNILGLQPGVL